MIRLAFAFLLSLCVSAQAQLSGGVGGFPGPGTAHSSAYVGPGDIVTMKEWGSCTFAYSAALANTTTSLCDLVAVTGGAAVCTLRASSSGAVDQSAYCPGSLTPSAACAAASGGSCRVTKVYAQVGVGGGWTQATLAKMPDFSFSGLNSLPAINCVSARTTTLISGSVASQAQPYTFAAVALRTSGTGANVLASNLDTELGFDGAANTASLYANGGANITVASVTDGVGHVMQGTANAASSTLNVDALTQGTGNPGSASVSASSTSICTFTNGSTNPLNGFVGEAGFYAGTYNSTVQTNMKTRWGL